MDSAAMELESVNFTSKEYNGIDGLPSVQLLRVALGMSFKEIKEHCRYATRKGGNEGMKKTSLPILGKRNCLGIDCTAIVEYTKRNKRFCSKCDRKRILGTEYIPCTKR